jgi:hypothetical protein
MATETDGGIRAVRTSDRREQLPRGERRPLSSEVGMDPVM